MKPFEYGTKVILCEIKAIDGLEHEEKTISTNAKLWILEQLILAGFKRVEVTNLGTPKGMPQFADAADDPAGQGAQVQQEKAEADDHQEERPAGIHIYPRLPHLRDG
jgi:isopropylmalate/homocitrate/citramalate synthase